MDNVGILTFHRAVNYGAALQAVALYQKCEELKPGTTTIIDYYCRYIEDQYLPIDKPENINSIKKVIMTILQYRNKKARFDKFKLFIDNNTRLSERVVTLEEINSLGYEAIITGSDQVWNNEIAGFDSVYFLHGISDNTIKYSYAASLGLSHIPDQLKNDYRKRLDCYKKISVREKSAANLLSPLINKKLRIDIDPTLLLKKEQWDLLTSDPIIKRDYILLYTVEKPLELLKVVRWFAKKMNLPVIYINNGPGVMLKNPDFKYVTDAGPSEFLSLFKNANFVFTNSFHGTVFSIVFQKKFIVELDNKRTYNHRSKDLLDSLNISMCDTKDLSDIFEFLNTNSVDWNSVEKMLDEIRMDSQSYLYDILYE